MGKIQIHISKLLSLLSDSFTQYKAIIAILRTDLILLDETVIKDNIIDFITKHDIELPLNIQDIEKVITEKYPEYLQNIKNIDMKKKKEILNNLQIIVDAITSQEGYQEQV